MVNMIKLFFFISIIFCGSILAQNPNYDSTLAHQMDADEYGMKSYVLVILTTGTNDTTDKAFINECFSGHMSNIHNLVAKKKMIVAGPLGANDLSYRGIFILDVKTIKEAEVLLQLDPAIGHNLLGAEIIEWYGSASLPSHLETANKVWLKKP